MSSTLSPGLLVEIRGKSLLDTPEEWRKVGVAYSGPKAMSGQRGQLTEYNEAKGEWMVATFGADMVSAKEADLTPLTAADVTDFDVALGPASSSDCMGTSVTDWLSSKGYAVCKMFVAPEDLEEMVATADKCVEEGAFSRLSTELETGYLGKFGTGKTLSIDMESEDTADFLKASPLTIVEDAISSVGVMLRPFVEEEFGFDIFSRSSSMLALPFDGDEDSYRPPDLENQEAADFVSMMWRAKLQVITNAGPANATLTLIPKLAGDQEVSVTVLPGMLAIFATDRFKFSYRADGKALMISAWYLDVPKDYIISSVTGDIMDLTGSTAGAPMPKSEPVCVTSMATRYAFGVDEPWKLWVGYAKAGMDVVTKHPFLRWDCEAYYDPEADQTSGKSYTCHGGFSDGIELFDCRFFDISPAEARGMDPTQRQVLEVSYISLHGAGWAKKNLSAKPAQIAVFVGLDKNEWNTIPKDTGGGFGASSSANAITSNRVNYCLNLKGASMTIDTACSASLVCSHTAKLYLLHKQFDPCEAVIVTGVNLSISPFTYIGGCGAGMHSHIGRCFTYNFSADGYARGEATASTSFKNKTFDPESGDFCMLAGSQANQDGRSASLTAPNGPAQERCNLAVIKECKLRPPEIDTTECHGTGTSLGDPIEIGAYRKVMASDPRTDPVVVTSSKSNLGHCEGSAGVSGLLKCVLLCMYGEATPNCHLSALNPHLDMDGFPGIITTESCVFKAQNSYNSVLSFGFGGTNACAMVWAPHCMTSRSTQSLDVSGLVVKRMQDAPAQAVTITGDDWEEWEMDGPGRFAKPGDLWDVELMEDGGVSYWRKERELPDAGAAYYLKGSFNDWTYDVLDEDGTLSGLHSGIIVIGSSGREEFQVVAEQDDSKTFSASWPGCSQKSAAVQGPGPAPREATWCINGTAGDRFRVSFFASEAGTYSISWMRDE